MFRATPGMELSQTDPDGEQPDDQSYHIRQHVKRVSDQSQGSRRVANNQLDQEITKRQRQHRDEPTGFPAKHPHPDGFPSLGCGSLESRPQFLYNVMGRQPLLAEEFLQVTETKKNNNEDI